MSGDPSPAPVVVWLLVAAAVLVLFFICCGFVTPNPGP